MLEIEKKKYYKMFTINVIMTIIDEFQQLNLFVFELLFYVISDMSVKSIIKFVVSLVCSLVQGRPNKIWGRQKCYVGSFYM